MQHDRTDHEPATPAALAPELPDDAATATLANAIADAIASGAAQPRIERILPDGTVEVRPITATPDEWRAAVHRAAAHATALQLGGNIDDESQAEKGA
ncbi:hypothetical protein SAMN05444166_5675 [Singulisphaera sp. GP187]|uniref:hypothetical protein n=1 Tax=Singulisphaera sp. GP187 TaxID=1882752 RepID=UPI000928A9E1|nr:hypothetical protein [Singulisphaera sp. GP187]SIO58427.1 hypothetical protein SAMN05444166_5675 [Singulisphaera sp. GP187]